MIDTICHGGGAFLLTSCGSVPTFVPENLSDTQHELAKLASEFSTKEALAITDRIEASEPGLVSSLLKKAGSLGLLMAEIPEDYGGLGLSKADATLIAENMTHQGSFCVAFLCHTGIGTLPLLYYGTPEQKVKFLPKLGTGEMIGAYALTESEAGSDALAGRMRAALSPDGKYYLISGEKVYITNGGIADLYTIFAKIDGDKFTAFLVERDTPGFTVGHEEGKMGICGSSTTALVFNDAKVPVENVLGKIGEGHKIAFNTLNIGRFKLGAACVGSSKRLLESMLPQANSRRQFGKTIGSFELIRQKLARTVCRTYILESLAYRFAGDLDARLAALDKNSPDYVDKLHDAIEEYSVEAAIAKVYASEQLWASADDAVQLFGGAGYIRGYFVEQEYRDCRINRIFEGTNEICRLIIPGTLIKRAMAGRIPLMQRLGEILSALKTGFQKADSASLFVSLVDQVESVKRLSIYLMGVAMRKFGETLKDHQAVIEIIADVVMEAYVLDSAVSRAITVHNNGDALRAKRYSAICEAWCAERIPWAQSKSRQALINIADANASELESYLKALDRTVSIPVINTDRVFDEIARRVLEKEKYDL